MSGLDPRNPLALGKHGLGLDTGAGVHQVVAEEDLRRWLEPSLLNGASAERRGLDRFDIGIGIALPLELGAIAPDHRHRHNGYIGKKV